MKPYMIDAGDNCFITVDADGAAGKRIMFSISNPVFGNTALIFVTDLQAEEFIDKIRECLKIAHARDENDAKELMDIAGDELTIDGALKLVREGVVKK